MLTVHLILNSHLDPIWLWGKSQGIDEVLSTARTACDVLDDYPEIYLVRGEVWFYETVERFDPATFERIRQHIAGGRWKVVGNWYVQPDCNLSGPETLRRHNEIGTRYFRRKFGVKVRCGFNVDSFGHPATLPDFYVPGSVRYYICQRPSPSEQKLPNIFWWESPSGRRLLQFHIDHYYCTQNSEATILDNLNAAIENADPAIGHTMCFIGLGDHGGGPTRWELDWLRRHLNWKKEVRLVFSHPEACFQAIEASGVELPVIRDELQHCMIGCYSGVSRIKREVRQAENLLEQAGTVVRHDPGNCPADAAERLEAAWKGVLFATFHDVLAGTALRSALEEIYDELGEARTVARRIIVESVRKRNVALAPNPRQQLIFDNTAERPFDGLVECSPWLRNPAGEYLYLTDLAGNPVPMQRIQPESAVTWTTRLAVRLQLPPHGRRILLAHTDVEREVGEPLPIEANRFGNAVLTVRLDSGGIVSLCCRQQEFLAEPVRFKVFEDPSNTWGQDCYRFTSEVLSRFHGDGVWLPRETGELLSELGGRLHCEFGTISLGVRLAAGEAALRLRFRLDWHGIQKLVKLCFKPNFKIIRRREGVPGGEIAARPLDGAEYPVRNYTILEGETRSLAVVSADVQALDIQPDNTVRLTLLRSPYFVNVWANELTPERDCPVTDQGEHDYLITFLPVIGTMAMTDVEAEILRQTDPVVFSESTLGFVNQTPERFCPKSALE